MNNSLITHEISVEDGITVIKFLAKPTYQDLVNIIDDIIENYPYERRLWDLSEINFDLSLSEIQQIADYGKQKFIKPNKLALFATQNLVFGEMKQFEAYREEENHALPKVFRSKTEAMDWLKE